MCKKTIVIIVLVVVIVILLVMSWNRSADIMAGLWKVDPDFADSANIESLFLFIEETKGPGKKIILTANGKNMIGHMTLLMPYSPNKFYASFSGIDFWPGYMTLALDPLQNKLTLSDSSMSYGSFHKITGPDPNTDTTPNSEQDTHSPEPN